MATAINVRNTTSNNITLTYNGNRWMYIWGDGLANNTVVSQGCSVIVSSAGEARYTTVSSVGSMFVSANGEAKYTTVLRGGYVYVRSDGDANWTQVSSGGYMNVSNGGFAGSTTISKGGSVTVLSGGAVNRTTVASSGALVVFDGGVANFTTVSGSGTMTVSSGAKTTSTTLSGGRLFLRGSATKVDISGGYVDVSAGAQVSSAVVASGGSIYASAGGSTFRTVVSRSGCMIVYGGTATSTTIYSGGSMFVSNNGLTNSATLSGGTLFLRPGGSTFRTVMSSGAFMRVYDNAKATSTTVYSKGCMHVSSGGTATTNTILSSGRIWACSGGTTLSTTVSKGGVLAVFEGGTAISTTVTGLDAAIVIRSDGKHTGRLQIAEGATVLVSEGGLIDFDISTVAPETTAQVSGFSRIEGSPNFTITVSSEPTLGKYNLADGVGSGFDKTITVVTDSGTTLGTVKVGQTLEYNDIDYSLGLASGQLTLTVAAADLTPPAAPTVTASTTEPTNQNVVLTATFSADSKQRQYRFYAFDTWKSYALGVTITKNGTVYFRGVNAKGIASQVTTYTVTNIDKVAPDKPTAAADITGATNQNVTVTATFSSDSAQKQYSLDNSTWQSYSNSVVMSQNGTVYFRGIDAAGNISEVTEYAVANIDKTAPAKPTAAADVTAPTNQNVTVTASFSADSVKKEYSLDNSAWQNYTTGVTMSANGTVYFRAADAVGNVSEVASYTVSNIDKTPPAKPTAKADVTTQTTGSVTVTATFSGDSVKKEYSLDNKTWQNYSTGVTFTANGAVYFRAADAVGNVSEVTNYAVSNIITPGAEVLYVSADITTPTNQDVTVTAVFGSDTVQKQYSFDNASWDTYTDAIIMVANGTVYFRGINAKGTPSAVKSYTVTNIDKEPPALPVIQADITAPTNQDVTLTAAFSGDSVVKEYSFDGLSWQPYTAGVVLSQNGTVYFRAADSVGNYTDPESYTVTNIDKEPPLAPVVTASTTLPTNQDVALTAFFSDDSTTKEYSFDGLSWTAYTGDVVMTGNGMVYFRAADALGNYSETASYTVDNIDRDAPEKPVVSVSTTAPTNQNVIVTAAFSDDSTTREYSFDKESWQTYTTGVTMTQNGTVYFRAADVVDNHSEVASFTVTNIDKVAPAKPTAKADVTTKTTGKVTVTATFPSDSVKREYSIDNKTWKTYDSGVVFSKNGTAYFRATDAAGNVSQVASYAVTNITGSTPGPTPGPEPEPDPEPGKEPKRVFTTSGSLAAGAEAVFTPGLEASGLYKLTGTAAMKKCSVTVTSGGKKVGSGSVKNGDITFRKELLLDRKLNCTITIRNNDKTGENAAYTLKLAATELFTKGDNTDDTLAKAKTLATGTPANDWVGYGDAVDHWKLGVDAQGGFYDVDIYNVRNPVKLTIYSAQGRKVKGVSVSAKKSSVVLTGLCLANGSYAVVEAPKAKKALNSDYSLLLTEKATFTGAKNNDWSQAEVLAKGATFAGTLTKAAGGDVVDYCDVSKIDSLTFDMTAGKTKVSFFDAQHNAVKAAVKLANGAEKIAASLTLAANNAATDHFNLAAIDDAVKYLKIEASGKTLNGYTITKIA